MTDRQAAIADEINSLGTGHTVHIDGHEITKLAGDTEAFDVDGKTVCFVEVWDIVTGRTR